MACNGMPSSFFPPNFFYQMHPPMEESHPLLPTMPQDLGGVAAMLGKRPSLSFEEMGGGEDELSDDGFQVGEKKRRLNIEQVRTLEKNFELGNKLEPERKMQLARALGLQPRQIAIWFQNRRARWKTKKLEKDYEVLHRQFDAVKAENDAFHEQNKKLQAELFDLKGIEGIEPINLNKETEGSSSNRSENSSDINLAISRTLAPATDNPTNNTPNQGIAFFPMNQLLQATTRPELHCPNADNGVPVGHEENLCGIFGGIDDQSGFWAWSEQNNFHGYGNQALNQYQGASNI